MPNTDAELTIGFNLGKAIEDIGSLKSALADAFKKIDGKGFTKLEGRISATTKDVENLDERLSSASANVTNLSDKLKELDTEKQVTLGKIADEERGLRALQKTWNEKYERAPESRGSKTNLDAQAAQNRLIKENREYVVLIEQEQAKLQAEYDKATSSANEVLTAYTQQKDIVSQIVKDVEVSVQNQQELSVDTKDASNNIAELRENLDGSSSSAQSFSQSMKDIASVPNNPLNNLPQPTTSTSDDISDMSDKLLLVYDIIKTIEKNKQGIFTFPLASKSLTELMRKLLTLKALKRDIEKAGIPADSTVARQYLLITNEIDKTQAAIKKYKQGLKEAKSATKSSGKEFKFLTSTIRTLKSSIHGLAKPLSKVKSSFNSMAHSMKSNFKHLITSITKYVLGFRSLFFLVRRLRKYLGEGIQNLVKFNDGSNIVNESITDMLSSLLFLKNAWAAAFSPIITVVRPILVSLIDSLAEVGNAVARFMGALLGQEVVFNAVRVKAQDYADSLDNVGGSASGAAGKEKKLTDRLAAFDDLNVLGVDDDPDGTGRGGGGGIADDYLPDPNEMFTIVGAVSDFAKMIKDAFNNGLDFTDVGSTLANKIVDGLNNINWSVIQAWAINIGHGIGTFLVGALGDPAIWVAAGEALAEGVNTISVFFDSLLNETSNIDFGGGFALLINKFFSGIDWEQVSANLQETSEQLVANINSFFATLKVDDIAFDLGTLASSLTTAIVNVILGLNWEDIKNAAITIGSSILGGIQEGLESSDSPLFQNIGNLIGAIGQSFETLFPVISQVLDAALLIVNSVLPIVAEILPPIAGIIAELASTVFPVIQELLQIIFPIISQIVSAVLPVLQAVITSLQPVFEAFSNTILPIITEFLSHLMPLIQSILGLITGILNDSGDLGTSLIELTALVLKPLFALLNPIFDILTVIFDLLGELLPPIVALISPLLDLLMLCLQPIFDNFDIIAEIIEIAIVPLLKGLSAIIKVTVVPILNIMVSATQLVSQALDHLREITEGFRTAWKNVWESVRTFTNGIFNSIISAIEGLVNGMIGGINKAIGAVNSMSFTVPDWIPEVGGESFGFTLREISTISLPRLAQGAVIPPNREFMAVLGDQSHGTNIEAPLDTIKQAVAEVMANNGNAEMIQLLQQLITVVENKNLVIGDKEIGRANARYVKQQNIVRGATF